MNKIMLAVPVFLISSYFVDPIGTAEASGHHSAHKASKHSVVKARKSGHRSNNHQSMVSWYGPEFHGKKTASGQKYDMYAMTAAHKTLPLLSYAKVTNLKNHRSVVVRINDRGSFHGRRDMDLSYAAAKELGISGLGSVEITPLSSNEGVSPLSHGAKTNKRG
ncbi:septal ring lytic transglycosylase RlpA family protein [Candidatus Methylobacter oryzae]|uniref:Endolytic peptidoglycan transglycosylase RlpA n=1 Tax=Candidatus Methylobacter oryzae TaxID=2497749 RepID=A0ABY3CG58_9GAMM|nr:septal ring lytic transglycosylase RlpA family protein [Candidatus Methylobacter oryzae]TRX02669.1 septal ring lytic transglycosylase RlpA family protein [Candidatus Methylobacter oryzae]